MKNMKVATKLSLSFMIVIILTIIVGIVGVVGMLQIGSGSTEMYASQAQPLSDLSMARDYFQRLRVRLRDTVLASGDLPGLDQIEDELHINIQGFTHYIELYRLTVDDQEMIDLLDEIMIAFNEYQWGMADILASARRGVPHIQLLITMESLAEPTDFIVEGLTFLAVVRVAQAVDLNNINQFWFNLLFSIIVASIVIALVTALFFSEYLSSLISRPLNTIVKFIHKLSDGEVDIDDISENAIAVDSTDEVGILARTLEQSYILLHEHERSRFEAENASKAKSDFLSKMSHEIRTPMNAILGMAEFILREDISAAAREQALTIKHSGDHLMSILNDILDFSKIESGKMETVDTPYYFHSTVNDVINIVKMRMTDTGLQFAAYVDSSIPGKLIGDEVRLRQILLNILTNAVKYTKDGYFTLDITGEKGADNTILLIIKVKDTGIGIKSENIEGLFDEFAQCDSKVNHKVEGTGLGLAITNSLVQLMGGSIAVYSEYGKGSEFTIRLPQKQTDGESKLNIPDFENEHVLLYDKTPIYTEYTARALKDLGINHCIISNDEALKMQLSQNKYGYVFVEENMVQVVKNIVKASESQAKIIMMSDTYTDKSEPDVSRLFMPAYFLSIVNVLTGQEMVYTSDAQQTVDFTAPTAKILVVDDIDINLMVCEGMLEPYDAQVTLCESGHKAIAAMQREDFDLILMDHMMPEMDGVEAVNIIRNMPGKFAYIPIVALTANTIVGMKEMFLQNGFSDFLAKPIEVAKLNSILAKWIPKEKQVS